MLPTLLLLPLASGLKFDLAAQTTGAQRCIRNLAAKDTLVVVTATVGGTRTDGQHVHMVVVDTAGNSYGRQKDIVGEARIAFTTHADASFDVCLENGMDRGLAPGRTPEVELDVDIGADARDWSALQAAEQLRPVEVELRRMEGLVEEVVLDLDYLREREQRLRDTNESTNERVKWFALCTMAGLVGVGGWQVVYLRTYFKRKHLI